jgi:hypothetical protein
MANGTALRTLVQGVLGEGGGAAVRGVAEAHCGSLVDIVSSGFDWMMAMKGEGMVISHPALGEASTRVIPDCHFRKTATEYDRKTVIKWLSCTEK